MESSAGLSIQSLEMIDLVFDDLTVGDGEIAGTLVNDLPVLIVLAPVELFGQIDIQIIAAIALLELHQHQVAFTGVIENIELAVFDFDPGSVAIYPALVTIPALEVTSESGKVGARIVLAVSFVIETFPVD